MNVLNTKAEQEAKAMEASEGVEDELHELTSAYAKDLGVHEHDRRTSNFQFAEKMGVK
jgi:hypothetical protein